MSDFLINGDYVYMQFQNQNPGIFLGISTKFNVDIISSEVNTDSITDLAFLELEDYYKEQDSFNFQVKGYKEPQNLKQKLEFEKQFHLHCLFQVESVYANIDDKIRYKTQVRLKHRYSNLYLTYAHQHNSHQKKIDQIFELQSSQNQYNLFLIQSLSKARIESDPLENHNIIAIQISCLNEEYLAYDKNVQISSQPQPLIISKFSKSADKEKEYIYSGDLIRLLHIDADGCIQGKFNEEFQQKLSQAVQENNLEEINEILQPEKTKLQYQFSLKQNSTNISKFKTLGGNNIFLVMKKNIFDGSIITKKDQIRLLHIASNKFFDFSDFENDFKIQEQNYNKEQILQINEQQAIDKKKLIKINTSEGQKLIGGLTQIIKNEIEIQNQLLSFDSKQEKVRFNKQILITSDNNKRILKVKDIMNEQERKKKRNLTFIVGSRGQNEINEELTHGKPQEPGIFEQFNPLQVNDTNTIQFILFAKDIIKVLSQIITMDFQIHEKITRIKFFKIFKFLFLSFQSLLRFLVEDEQNDSEINKNNQSKSINLQKFKIIYDLNMLEYILILNAKIWNSFLRGIFIDKNKKFDMIANGVLKSFDICTEVTNLICQCKKTIKIIQKMQLFDVLVDQIRGISSKNRKTIFYIIIERYFPIVLKEIKNNIITELINIFEQGSSQFPLLEFREIILETLTLLACPDKNNHQSSTKQIKEQIVEQLIGPTSRPNSNFNLQSMNIDIQKFVQNSELWKKSKFWFYLELNEQNQQIVILFDNINNPKFLNNKNQYLGKCRPPYQNDSINASVYEKQITEILMGKPEWDNYMNLHEFLKQNSNLVPYQKYFQSQLRLITALASGSHKIVHTMLEKIIPLDLIKQFLLQCFEHQNNDFNKEICSNFLNITIKLYLNHQTLQMMPTNFNQLGKLIFNIHQVKKPDLQLIELIKSKNLSLDNDYDIEEEIRQILKKKQESRLKFRLKSQQKNIKQKDSTLQQIKSSSLKFDNSQSSQDADDSLNEEDDKEDEIQDILQSQNVTDLIQPSYDITQIKNQFQSPEFMKICTCIAEKIVEKEFLKEVENGNYGFCNFMANALHLFKVVLLRNLKGKFMLVILTDTLKYQTLFDIMGDLTFQLQRNDQTQEMNEEQKLNLQMVLNELIQFVWIQRDFKQYQYTEKIWKEIQRFCEKKVIQNPYLVKEHAIDLLQNLYKGGLKKILKKESNSNQKKNHGHHKTEKDQKEAKKLEKLLSIEEKFYKEKQGFEKDFVKQIRNQFQDKSNTLDLSGMHELNAFIKKNNNQIIDFLPLTDCQKEDNTHTQNINQIMTELYEIDFQYVKQLRPNENQLTMLQLFGKEENVKQSSLITLYKDLFPLTSIENNISQALIISNKGELGMLKLLDKIKAKLQNYFQYEGFIEETSIGKKDLQRICYQFVQKPDEEFYPALLECFHVELYQQQRCELCGRWYSIEDVFEFNSLNDGIEINQKGTEHIFKLVQKCQSKCRSNEELKKYQIGGQLNLVYNYEMNHINRTNEIPESNYVDRQKQLIIKNKQILPIILNFLIISFNKYDFNNKEHILVLKNIFLTQENDNDKKERGKLKKLILSYCFKFIKYYIMDNDENLLELFSDSKFLNLLTNLQKSLSPFADEVQDILIEFTKQQKILNEICHKYPHLLVTLLQNFQKLLKIYDDYSKNIDYFYKQVIILNNLLHVMKKKSQFFLKENFINEDVLLFFKKTINYFFLPNQEQDQTEEFIGKETIWKQILQDFQQEQNRDQEIFSACNQSKNIKKSVYLLACFELISNFFLIMPEYQIWIQNLSISEKNERIFTDLFDYLLNTKISPMLRSKNIIFLLNVFIEGSQLQENNFFYKNLKNPDNFQKFLEFIDKIQTDILQFSQKIQNKKNIYRFAMDYMLNEYLIINSIIPFAQKVISNRTIAFFFQPFFKFADVRFIKLLYYLMKLFQKGGKFSKLLQDSIKEQKLQNKDDTEQINQKIQSTQQGEQEEQKITKNPSHIDNIEHEFSLQLPLKKSTRLEFKNEEEKNNLIDKQINQNIDNLLQTFDEGDDVPDERGSIENIEFQMSEEQIQQQLQIKNQLEQNQQNEKGKQKGEDQIKFTSMKQLFPKFIDKFKKLINTICLLGFEQNFVIKQGNYKILYLLYQTLENDQYIDHRFKKHPYLKDFEMRQIKKLTNYLNTIQKDGNNLSLTEKSNGNIKKFFFTEIIPHVQLSMRQFLKNYIMKNIFHISKENEYPKINLPQDIISNTYFPIMHEFWFFMNVFEDLLLYLCLKDNQLEKDDGNIDDEKEIEKQDKMFHNMMSNKYKGQKQPPLGKDDKPHWYNILLDEQLEKSLQTEEQKQAFIQNKNAIKNNVKNLFQNIFSFIEETQFKKNSDFQHLNIGYLQVFVNFLAVYGYSEELTYIQNYLVLTFETHIIVMNAIGRTVHYLSIENTDFLENEQINILSLLQFIKFGSALIAKGGWSQNPDTQDLFIDLLTQSADVQRTSNSNRSIHNTQLVIQGFQKILSFSIQRMKIFQKGKMYDIYVELIKSTLKFLYDLCSYKNQTTQNYLRYQPKSIKSINIVYEICQVTEFFIEVLKKQYFHYITIPPIQKSKKDLEIIDSKLQINYGTKPHPRYIIDWSKQSIHGEDYVKPIVQAIQTLLCLINGPNVENIKILMSTISPERFNYLFQFLSSYMFQFDFKFKPPSYEQFVQEKYYGCFYFCSEYIRALQENEAAQYLESSIVKNTNTNQAPSSLIQNQFKNTIEEDLDDTMSKADMLSSASYQQYQNEVQQNHKGGVQVNYLQRKAKLIYQNTMIISEEDVRKYSKYKCEIQENKKKFNLALFDLERFLLYTINYFYQCRFSVTNEDNLSIKLYLEKFDYELCLDNLFQRFEDYISVQKKTIIKNIVQQYYILFLYNISSNEEKSAQIKQICNTFQAWESHSQFAKIRDRKNLIGQIEIINKEQLLQRIFFRIPKKIKKVQDFHVISKTRSQMTDQINRDNPEDKVKDMQIKFNSMHKMVLHQNMMQSYIYEKRKKFQIFGNVIMNWKNKVYYQLTALSVITLFQNFLQVYFTTDQLNSSFYYQSDLERVDDDIYYYILGSLGILLSFNIMIIEYIDFNLLNYFEIKEQMLSDAKETSKLDFLTRCTCNKINCKNLFYSFISFVKSLFTGTFFLYFTVFFSQVIGFFYNSSFYSYSLILILWEFDLTKDLLISVFQHIDQVVATIILSVIILYWFTIITFNSQFKGQYHFEDNWECGTLWNCLRLHFDFGYTANPKWRQPDPNDEAKAAWSIPLSASASSWNFFFNLIISTIMTAIISGIIIDTFGERREQKEKIEEDNSNRCFICNIDREEFERAGQDFEYHQENEHSFDNYLYYFIFIKKISNQYTDIDKWVYNNIMNNQIDHMPIKQCLMLQETNKRTARDIPNLDKKLSQEIESLKKYFEDKLQDVEKHLKSHIKRQN